MDKITAVKHKLYTKRAKQLKQARTRDQDKQKQAIQNEKNRLKAITDNCIKLRAERLARRRDDRTKNL